MIAMLDTSERLEVCESEIGCSVEQLFTPLTRFLPQNPLAHFGIDNGCFKKFDEQSFLALLAREYDRRHLCRFVCCPDIVGEAVRTLELFDLWSPRLEDWPIALVAQDLQENHRIPWEKISAIFIGGTTQWKDGPHAAAIVKTAKMFGKWVHVGRINTPGRFEKFRELGADSMDGSGLARFSHMRQDIYDAQHKPTLFNNLKLDSWGTDATQELPSN